MSSDWRLAEFPEVVPCKVQLGRHSCVMTHDVLEAAIREGIPFAINMADGPQYEVRAGDRVILGKTRMVLMGDRDLPHVLPLLTVTGVSYLPSDNDAAHS